MDRITPAGHLSGIAANAYTAEPKSELERAFREWKNNVRRDYVRRDCHSHALAKNALREIEYTIDELHSLVLRHHDPFYAGRLFSFISAGYISCEEKTIVYDLDVPLNHLGFHLPPDKLLVNKGRVGNHFAYYSKGVILNCGIAGEMCGAFAEGVVVNAANTGEHFGISEHCGIAIALSRPKSYAEPSGALIDHKSIPQELAQYLEKLIAACKGPVGEIYSRYGSTPASTIQRDVKQLLEQRVTW